MLDRPYRVIDVRCRRGLHHWTTPEGTYSTTFRLWDSLPQHVLRELAKNQSLLRRQRAEQYLDRGEGSCVLGRNEIARVVADALRYFHGQRYILHAWCVMLNHVHVAFRVRPGWKLEQTMHSWKSYTSKRINSLLGRSGAFWQHESFDRLLHDQHELDAVIEYIIQNPVKAGLQNWPWSEVVDRQFRFSEE